MFMKSLKRSSQDQGSSFSAGLSMAILAHFWGMATRMTISQMLIPLTLILLIIPPTLLSGENPDSVKNNADLPAVLLEQEVRGLPGLKSEIIARQRLTILPNKLLLEALPTDSKNNNSGENGNSETISSVLLSAEGANRVILDLSSKTPQIFEIIDHKKKYKVRSANLSHLQEDRDNMELNIIEHIKTYNKKSERDKACEKNHIQLDGTRTVKVKYGGTREILGYSCREVEVTENGRRVIHAWMTTEITGGNSFYQLYQGLGAFSREVLARVKEIEGLPLEATIKVVTAAPAYDIKATCLLIKKDVLVSPGLFSIPDTYQKIEETPGILPCPICGKEFEWDEPGGSALDPITKIEYRTCSRECHKRMVAIINKRIDEFLENKDKNKKKK